MPRRLIRLMTLNEPTHRVGASDLDAASVRRGLV